MAGRHSRPVAGGRAYWLAERLWALARDLPVREVPVVQFERDPEPDYVVRDGA